MITQSDKPLRGKAQCHGWPRGRPGTARQPYPPVRQFSGPPPPHPKADQLGRSAGKSQVSVVRNLGPLRVSAPRRIVPLAVEVGESVVRVVKAVDGTGARIGMSMKNTRAKAGSSARKRRYARHPARSTSSERCRVAFPCRRDDRVDQEVATVFGRGQEAVFLVGEMGVKGRSGHLCPAHDVGDRQVAEAVLGDGSHCRGQ